MKKIMAATMFLLLLALPAYANGGGLTGGALEVTQQANRALLSALEELNLTTANNTVWSYAKQLQQYANEVQQLAEAVKNTITMPFALVNDLKNSGTNLYGTIKGTGEGLYSYANADNWYNGVTSRTGALAQIEHAKKSTKAAMKNMDDIITKEESEAYLMKQAEDMSRAAQGTTSAVQANTVATLATAQAVKNQTAVIVNAEKRRLDNLAMIEAADLAFQEQCRAEVESDKQSLSAKAREYLK